MQSVSLIQGTPEWHEFRQKHIGGSDASVCLGESKYMSPYELYLEKIGEGKPKKVTTIMHQGNILEEPARKAFEQVMDVSVFPVVRKHKEYDFMAASMDGLDMDEKIAVEIKCPFSKIYHQMALNGVMPDHHMPQVQHQMSVLNIDKMYYFSYTIESHGLVVVNRDDDYIKNLISKEKEFWEMVQSRKPPELTDKDYLEMESTEWKELSDEWNRLCEMDDRKEAVRQRIIALSGAQNAKGYGIRLTKVMRKGSVDYKAVPMLKGVDLEAYRKPSNESYRITKI